MKDLLLLAIATIIISEYAERKSLIGSVANAVFLVSFALCSLFASDNSVCVYLCKYFFGDIHPILHAAIVAPMAYIRVGYSAYLAVQMLILIVVLLAGAISMLHVFYKIKDVVLAMRDTSLRKRQNLDAPVSAAPSRQNTIFLLFSRLLN